jgi:hypothetical protein
MVQSSLCSYVFSMNSYAVSSHSWQMYAYTAAIILLLNIWGSQRFSSRIDLQREMDDVNKCIKILKAHESRLAISVVHLIIHAHLHNFLRTRAAVHLGHQLTRLASLGDRPLLFATSSRGHKRRQEDEPPTSDRDRLLGNSAAVQPFPQALESNPSSAYRSKQPPLAQEITPEVHRQATPLHGPTSSNSTTSTFEGEFSSWPSTNSLDALINSFTQNPQMVHSPANMQEDLMAMWADVPPGFGYFSFLLVSAQY